jgi:hypothetical protein
MSKLIDRLAQIRQGAPGPLGFGAARAEKTPGMALICHYSTASGSTASEVAALRPDGVLVSSDGGAKQANDLGRIPWGVRTSSLTEQQVQEYRESGCDFLAVSLRGTLISAVATEEPARILNLDIDVDPDQLRAIDALPVDALLVAMTGVSDQWNLEDLSRVALIAQWVNKYVLLEVSRPPQDKELEPLRNAGVHGLVLDPAASSLANIAVLKAALLEIPRPRSGRRERTTAILPGAVNLGDPGVEPGPEPDEDE